MKNVLFKNCSTGRRWGVLLFLGRYWCADSQASLHRLVKAALGRAAFLGALLVCGQPGFAAPPCKNGHWEAEKNWGKDCGTAGWTAGVRYNWYTGGIKCCKKNSCGGTTVYDWIDFKKNPKNCNFGE